MSTITAKIQLRRDTSANWTANNPILLAGEMALSTDVLYTGTDQPRYKIGNGVDAWLDLDYVPEGGAGSFVPYTGATQDVDLDNNGLNAKFVKIKGTDGSGKLDLKHQSVDATAGGQDTALFAGNDGELYYKNDGLSVRKIENQSNKGVANGYASLDSSGIVPSSQLPSYVDEILEYADLAAFPVTGETDKIYIALDTNKVYRWSGSTYIEVAANSGVWGAITGTITNQTDLVDYVKGYTLTMICYSTYNPSDNSIAYIGASQPFPLSTDNAVRLICPRSGTIKSVTFASRQTVGSGESSTIALGVNGSYSNISTSILFNGNPINTDSITGLSRSVSVGDYITIRLTNPTWATNPTNLNINVQIYIE